VILQSLISPPCSVHKLLKVATVAAVALASGAGVVGVASASGQSAAASSPPTTQSNPQTSPERALVPHGIGAVRFGLPKVKAVADLRARFGTPTAQGVNTGCGPRFTEVEWGDLAAEFRSGTFSGYRYITGGLPLTTHSKALKTVSPKLATTKGISLGSTVGQLRAAYKVLHLVGAARWQVSNGLGVRQ
jgi:hypothetical protein